MSPRRATPPASFVIGLLLAVTGVCATPVTHERLLAAGSEPDHWLTHGRDLDETRFNTDFCSLADVAINQATDAADPTGEAGRCYYYLVTGYNGNGEGPEGNATAGPREVNTTGACP